MLKQLIICFFLASFLHASEIKSPEGNALIDTGWVMQNSGTQANLYAVKAVDGSVAWVGGAGGVVFRTTNGGNTWLPAGTVGIDVYNIFGLNATTAFVASDGPSNARIMRSTDAGSTWQQVYQNTNPIAFIDNVTMFDATNGYAMGDPYPEPGGIWDLTVTSNGGTNWVRRDTLTEIGSEASWSNAMMWYDTSYGWFGTNSSRIYRTSDGGSRWSGVPVSRTNVYSVWFNVLTLGLADGILRSTDTGVSWSTLVNPQFGQVVGARGTNEFWVGSGRNISYTSDAGDSWTSAPPNGFSGSRNIGPIDMVTIGSSVYAWAVGDSGGILHYRRLVTEVPASENNVPQHFDLQQNYPNPFNPSTSIKYSLPAPAFVKLKVYNILGQEVATMVNAEQPAGYYEVAWDGKISRGASAPSGVYFFRIQAVSGDDVSSFVQTKKMLLIK